MKGKLLWFSLLLNGVLITTAIITRRPEQPRALAAPNAPIVAAVPTIVTPEIQPASTISNVVVSGAAPFQWNDVASDDFQIYVANLRAIGCPEQTVRDIVTGEINDRHVQARQTVYAVVQPQFWELAARANDDEFEAAAGKRITELSEQRRQLLAKVFLGAKEPADDEVFESEIEALMSDTLTAEKREQLRQLAMEQAYARKQFETDKAHPKEQQEKAKRMETEFEARRKALLSPEELAEFELRQTSFAGRVQTLRGFSASEQELKEIARLKSVSGDDEKKAAEAKLQQMLGAERYAALNRNEDPDFAALWNLGKRLNVPESKINQAADVIAQVTKENKAASGDDVPSAVRDVEMDQAYLKAKQTLTETFGEMAARIILEKTELAIVPPDDF